MAREVRRALREWMETRRPRGAKKSELEVSR
jgi:hypothetical protein